MYEQGITVNGQEILKLHPHGSQHMSGDRVSNNKDSNCYRFSCVTLTRCPSSTPALLWGVLLKLKIRKEVTLPSMRLLGPLSPKPIIKGRLLADQ